MQLSVKSERLGILSGAIMLAPQEIMSLIPCDTTAICGRESKRAQLASLSLRVGRMAPSPPITQCDASQRRRLLADVTELAVGAFL